MPEVLHLLIINIPRHLTSSLMVVLRSKGFIPNAHHIVSKREIKDSIDTNWDLILVSEEFNVNNFPLLSTAVKFCPDIPKIFITKETGEKVSEIAASAMNNGAKDCVSIDDLQRLMPIIKRELAHNRIKEDYQKTIKTKEILSNITDLGTEEIYLFKLNRLKCTYSNKTAIANTGYTQQELHQLGPADLFPEYNSESFQKLIQPLLDNSRDKISICTYTERKMGVVYPTETHLKKIEREDDLFILATNKDISGHWYKTQKLKRQRTLTQKYIRKSQQNSDLLSNAAHDMRTSLNSIILSNKLLTKKKNGDTENELCKLTNAIHHSGIHLLEYISEFIESPETSLKFNDIDMRQVSISSFCKQLYQVFNPIAQENDIQFNYDISRLAVSSIKTNTTYLKRILKNLLSNAFKYTHQGCVTFSAYSPAKRELEGLDFNPQKAIAFQVQDTGIGIKESEQDKVFDRHRQSSHIPSGNSVGSGLGLDICKQLTNALGGKLSLDSRIEIGSTFTLYLPTNSNITTVSTDPLFEKLDVAQQSNSSPNLDKTVLIVDDSKIHNLAIQEFLSYTFNHCVATSSRKEAFNILQKRMIDCVVLDYIISDTNSLDWARRLKNHQQFTDIPIIFYTGKHLDQQERQELHKYSYAIVKKNTDSHNKLVSTIFSSIRSRSSVH